MSLEPLPMLQLIRFLFMHFGNYIDVLITHDILTADVILNTISLTIFKIFYKDVLCK